MQSEARNKRYLRIRRMYESLICRPQSALIWAALFCTLAVKLYHSVRTGLTSEYLSWIVADVSFLLTVDVILALVCFRWPRKGVIRSATIVAAAACTWSVMNAAYLVRMGSQILPGVLMPLFRDPLSALAIVGVNLAKMPAVAAFLLGPSAVALGLLFVVLARPRNPGYKRSSFVVRTTAVLAVVVAAILAQTAAADENGRHMESAGLRFNCQLRALMSLIPSGSGGGSEVVVRTVPAYDRVHVDLSPHGQQRPQNIVILVLEGIQYRYTSLAPDRGRDTPARPGRQDRRPERYAGSPAHNLTPHLAAVARGGLELTNARSSVTHTTKALFALLTGRYPSISHDIVETVPVDKPYASLATILESKLGFRTAFFQSAKGSFEARPGLVHNLGFDRFWAREDLNDTDAFIGYLACDEFSMLGPLTEWMQAQDGPFLLVILCSVSHDPYEVPQWFAKPAEKPIERYEQAVRYTDSFIGAVDSELARLKLADETVFCVVGDHGEGFGEHGRFGHEGMAFEEVLRIPFVLRSRSLIEPGLKVGSAVGSIDLTPTLLGLLGFDVSTAGFAGVDVLSDIASGRKLYFSGWMNTGPAGFVRDGYKFVYDPLNDSVFAFDLRKDPAETTMRQLSGQRASQIRAEIARWRQESVFVPAQQPVGRRIVFDRWLCRWNERDCDAGYYRQGPQ